MPVPAKTSQCPYKSCYCEENIYKMCELLDSNERKEYFVVFISNDRKCIPLFRQKAASKYGYVLWDYHVILVRKGTEDLVYDLDTNLPFPTQFENYFNETVRSDFEIDDEFRRKFRVIPAEKYLDNFSSDRSHMRSADGSWNSPPPEWDTIWKNDKGNNISQFWSMSSEVLQEVSKVLDEEEFFNFFQSS